MDIQQLRQSLKMKWLIYYEQNRSWLVKMQVWGTYDGLRRPLSGYILATLSVLEPQFEQILSFILDLNNNPDQIVAALGLNFNPDEELHLLTSEPSVATNQIESESPAKVLLEDQAVSQVNLQSPVKKPLTGLSRGQKSFSFKITTGVEHQRQPGSSVAVATLVNRESPAKTLVSQKLPSRSLREPPPVRSLIIATEFPSKTKTLPSLAISTDTPRKSKTLPTLAMVTEVPSKTKTLPTLVFTEFTSNEKFVKMPVKDILSKEYISVSTNARSLASWVDECCQGRGWDRELVLS
ncbi:DUF5331 domain-containing protein [Cylindrospermum sp. FACHB-282]|uniref:DUF5331 domain-containing protein n=1 Tax=Cylindrospermum sp. FACHB-282 TaxID=2692794 RepID=UPI00168248A0|nr:DUF5331 domain-containing protein [Cylindrospermum sp. FACHB-282]MBD2383976.1 hypothetical protein [Cylindrospermum sp. FACHB-282]